MAAANLSGVRTEILVVLKAICGVWITFAEVGHRREGRHIISATAAADSDLDKCLFPQGGQGNFHLGIGSLSAWRARFKSQAGVMKPAADGARPWRKQRSRQQYTDGRSTSRGKFRWGVRPAPIVAPAGSARWAALCWRILNLPPARSRYPLRPRSSLKAKTRVVFT